MTVAGYDLAASVLVPRIAALREQAIAAHAVPTDPKS